MTPPAPVRRAAHRLRLGLFTAVAAIAAVVVACSTDLSIVPDDPAVDGTRADGGASDANADDVTASGPDGSGPPIVVDPSTACSLTFDRTAVVMGEVFASASHSETVTVTSISPNPTSISLALIGDGFSIPSPQLMLSASPKASFTVTFASAAAGPHTGTVAVAWGSGCQQDITLAATTVTSLFAVSPGALDLGAVPCGSTPPPGAIHVAASGGNTSVWSASISAGPFMVAPTGTVFGPGGDIPVTPSPLLPTTDPQRFTSSVTLKLAAESNVPRIIPVTATSLGGKLVFMPTTVTLTKLEPSQVVTLLNSGTQAVSVGLTVAAPFTVTPSKLTLLPQQPPTPITVGYAGGAAQVPATRAVTVSPVGGALCDPGSLHVSY